jgi:hypothetical protein
VPAIPLWASIVFLILASIAMVIAMVQFMYALVEVNPSESRRARWGTIYGFAWVAVVLAIGSVGADRSSSSPVAVATLALSGWACVNALWLQFWMAIGRAQQRQGGPRVLPPDAAALAAHARTVAAVSAIALGGALWAIGAPHEIARTMTAPGNRFTSIVWIVGGAGFAAFMTGAVRLALGVGTPMTRAEIEQMGATHPGYGVRRRRVYGPAKGVSGQGTYNLRDLVRAWRTGAWRRDPGMVSATLMLGGVVAATTAGLAALVVLGGATARTALAIAIIYTLVVARRGRRQSRG